MDEDEEGELDDAGDHLSLAGGSGTPRVDEAGNETPPAPAEVLYRGYRGTAAPNIDQNKVDYLAFRFPNRMAEARYVAQQGRPPYGPGYRDFTRIKLINGALRDLGMGNGYGELKSVEVPFRRQMITITAQDVMNTFGMLQSSYDSKRSRINLMYAIYLWLEENPEAWPSTKKGSLEVHFRETMRAFFGPEPLQPNDHPDAANRPAHIRDATKKAINKFYEIAQIIQAGLNLDTNSKSAVPELYA